ncbi:MAG: Wzt carbohydrate-binding domain-containing protein, partial [Pirellula staleyi]
ADGLPQGLAVLLAVGDAQFQKKCIGRMNEVRRDGRTVLFVSHNVDAVRSLCTRAILLEKGQLVLDSSTEAVIQRYFAKRHPIANSIDIPEDVERVTNNAGRIRSVSVSDLGGAPVAQLKYGQAFRVTFVCELFEEVQDGLFEVSVSTPEGVQVLMSTTIDGGQPPRVLRRGSHTVQVVIKNVLLPREYAIDVGIHHANGETIDYVPRAGAVEVLRLGTASSGDYPWPAVRGHIQGIAQWD